MSLTHASETMCHAAERIQRMTVAQLEAKLQQVELQRLADLDGIHIDLERRKREVLREESERETNLELRTMEVNVQLIECLLRENQILIEESDELDQLLQEERRVQAHLEAIQEDTNSKLLEAKECAREMEESLEHMEALIEHLQDSISDLEDDIDYMQLCIQAEYRTKLMYNDFISCMLKLVNSSDIDEPETNFFKGILDESPIRIEPIEPRLVSASARTA